MSSGAVTGNLVLNGALATNHRGLGLEVATVKLGPGGFFEASALDVAGRVGRDGSVSGTIAGVLELRINSSIGGLYSRCSGTFPWTLTPRE